MSELQLQHESYVSRALEISIHVGLLILLTVACLLILRPFVPLVLWGIIIAIATYPGYRKLQSFLGGRSGVAAIICDILLLAILIVPVVLLTGSFVDGIQSLVARLKDGSPIIPPPPARIGTWPIVGIPISNAWQLAYTNLSAALLTFSPEIRAVIPKLLVASAAIGLGLLQWILSIVIAGFLLNNGSGAAKLAHSLSHRVFGDRGTEFAELIGATIRSVTTGIIGVALIQSVLAALGFVVARMPGAGLWAATFLFAAVLQVGTVVLIPAAIYMFAIASTTKAVIFLIWCVIVGVMDNVLKPLLLGRGVPVPIAVVFLGAIGGFVAMGTIGLFLGSIVLSVGYKLLMAWMEDSAHASPEMREEHSASAHAGL
jgi:predicted PurR-regulated permease PerM